MNFVIKTTNFVKSAENVIFGFPEPECTRALRTTGETWELVALPFQTKGEVGCEALSSYSRPGSSGNTATPQRSSSMKQPCDNGKGMRNSFKRPQRCHAASKRKARSEGPRPRGPSGAGKIDLCTALPPCTSLLEHENHLFRDQTKTGQISSHSSSCLSFQLILAGFKAWISI